MLTSPAYSETLVPVQPVTLEDRPHSRCWWMACFSTDGLRYNASPLLRNPANNMPILEVVTAAPVAAW